tara:strand:- start:67 stop:300 length:234 start_codon:yes stop_codon:yes gene_type:complete
MNELQEFYQDCFQTEEPTEQQLENMYQIELAKTLLENDENEQTFRIYIPSINEFVYISLEKYFELQESDLVFEPAPF